MKNLLTTAGKLVAVAFSVVIASCNVSDDYDLSKDVDMTVAVGDGLSLPLGSTEEIKLTEMIDHETSDILSVDDDGTYIISKSGEFDGAQISVNKVEHLDIQTQVPPQVYHMNLKEMYASYEEAKNAIENDPLIPDFMKEEFLAELDNQKVPFYLNEAIDKSSVRFDFEKSGLPNELKKIYRVNFDNPVKMHLEVVISCSNDEKFNEFLNTIVLTTAGVDEEHFYVEVPQYVVLADGQNANGHRLYLDGSVQKREDDGNFRMAWDFYMKALDFSYKGGQEIVDGSFSLSDELNFSGRVESNHVWITAGTIAGGLYTFEDVMFTPIIDVDEFGIKNVVASVDVDIDDISKSVELDLGDDLDFLYDDGTLLDFANPELRLNVNNDSPLAVSSRVVIRGLDEGGQVIDGSTVTKDITIQPNTRNLVVINNTDNLNNLLKKLPHSVVVDIMSTNNSDDVVSVELGSSMGVSGNYEIVIPLEFNEIELSYTETIDNVFEGDTEFLDNMNDIEGLSLSADVSNTIPAAFTPEITAYDADGNLLENVYARLEGDGVISAGNGIVDGRLTDPVRSSIKIFFAAKNDELKELYTVKIALNGRGSGALNCNEYILFENIVIKLEEPLSFDFSDLLEDDDDDDLFD